jgi:hypothetical protein
MPTGPANKRQFNSFSNFFSLSVSGSGSVSFLKLDQTSLPAKGPLYPQKRTCAVQLEMSALGQKQTLHLLLNYFVGTGKKRR